MKPWSPILILVALVLLPAACTRSTNPIKIPNDAAKITVDFSWEGIQACTHESPEIRVSGIPHDTRELRVTLTNLSVPEWNQGGGTVVNDGSGIIPAGALNIGYNGPCPPPGQRYKYQFAVMAVDDQGTIIGFGKARQTFPPKQ